MDDTNVCGWGWQCFELVGAAFVVANRIRYDRRTRRLTDIARRLDDPALAALPPLERSPAIRRILSRLSRRAVYQMVVSTAFPSRLTEIFAAYSLEYLGLARMMLDASSHSGRTRWRRISALFALGHMRADGIYELLATALQDEDPEVAAAAATVLHRLGDRHAAAILISALRGGTLPPSRIATHLDRFAVAIHDLLRPLLRDLQAATRYWAASLLCQPGDTPGVVEEITALTCDPDAAVRKAARTTLGTIAGSRVVPLARRELADPIGYVRSTALRALRHHASLESDVARRQRWRRGRAVDGGPGMGSSQCRQGPRDP